MPQNKIIKNCILLVLIFFSCSVMAQNIANNINLYGINFPQEKIHIHFDKENYMPGETIWFKAYLFEENLPSNRSTNFYAALYDDKGKMLLQHSGPVFNGTADGYFTLPDTIESSQLICRAYTGWMLNFDTAFLYTHTLQVSNNKPVAVQNNDVKAGLQFFPEGGNLLEGAVNTIAFKANYANGLPFNIAAVIKKKETGEVVMPITAQHDGMGKFDIEMNRGDKYYAEWLNSNGIKEQTWLPNALPAGVVLKLSIQKDKLYYNLINKTGKDTLHILMYMYQKVFFETAIKVTAENAYTGVLITGNLPSGAMQITVFDADWQPLAERVAFINNQNFLINAGIISKEINTAKRGKNSIDILVADTTASDLSLSIVDADMYPNGLQNNIISDLLLKSELKGYIHNPAFYFSGAADASIQRSDLDLVMLTHGWRRYVWTNMIEKQLPAAKITADDFLQVYGLAESGAMSEKEKEEWVNLIVKTKDSLSRFYRVLPDKDGYVRQSGLVFYDSASVYYSFNKNKLLNNKISFSNKNSTLVHPTYIDNYENYLYARHVPLNFDRNTALLQHYAANGGIYHYNAEKTLQTVIVKTNKMRDWKNDPLVQLEQRYATGMFSGGALSYTFDVMHDEKAWASFDILNYLRNTVPGLRVGSFNAVSGTSITYREKPVLIYIDEYETVEGQLENINLKEVAMIKFIPNFFGRGSDANGSSINPAIVVYHRKGADFTDRALTETDIKLVKVAGYSPLKEFYSPDYSMLNTTSGTDARTTLLWVPYLYTNNANRKVSVSFYNNDFTKRMLLILEGVNADGKMIYIEKIIE